MRFSYGARALLGAGLAVALLAGCASQAGVGRTDFSPPAEARRISRAPFYPQRTEQCGPASLAAVLNHLGDPVTPEEAARAVYRPEAHGTLNLDLVLYARSRGYRSEWKNGEPGDLIRAVDRERLSIVMLDLGMAGVHKFHFAVVVGYGPDGILLNTGRTPEQLAPWPVFLDQWSGAGNWVMTVEPKAGP